LGPVKTPQAGKTTRRSEKEHLDARLDEALGETFPASDPIAVNPVQSLERKANDRGFEPIALAEAILATRADAIVLADS
jgi:hypothetical protein